MRSALILLITTWFSLSLTAQETHAQFFQRLTPTAHILTEDGMLTDANQKKNFLAQFRKDNTEIAYAPIFQKEVNSRLTYEMGTLKYDEIVHSVMFLKDMTNKAKVEFLVIYKQEPTEKNYGGLETQREEWVKLCNAHNAKVLVENLYTTNAYYYNRGRLLQGTEALSQEYAYMNSANYQLNLTPTFIEFVNDTTAFEIGQCSGSYPLPYMLLWKKQANGEWLILMDSNY